MSLLSQRKGVFSIDFFLATIVFLVLLVAFVSMWTNQSSSLVSRTTQSKLEQSVSSFSDSLMITTGSPVEWNASTYYALGLVSKPSVLSQEKISEFVLVDYEDSKNLIGFDYFVNASLQNGSIVFTKGVVLNGTAVASNRIGVLNGEIVFVRVTGYA